MSSINRKHVWRPNSSGLLPFAFVDAYLLFRLQDAIRSGIDAPRLLAGVTIFLLLQVFLWLILVRPKLVLDGNTVWVINPVNRECIPLDNISKVEGGRFLRIELGSGDSVTVWAVQNANITVMTKSKGRTHRVATEVNRLISVERITRDGDGASAK